MKKKLTAFIAFLITALVLVGCSIEAGPSSLLTGEKITADTADIDLELARVSSGSDERYQIAFKEGFGADVLIIDIRETDYTSGVTLNVRNNRGGQIAFSKSNIFGKDSDTVDLLSLDGNFSTQAIVPVGPAQCMGICVILPKSTYKGNTLIVDVDNPSNSSVAVHVYGADYQDKGEPTNDSISGAVELEYETSGFGAFETINDVDYWKPVASVSTNAIVPSGPVEVRIEMESADIEPFAEIYSPDAGKYFPLPLVRDFSDPNVYWTAPGSGLENLILEGELLVLSSLHGLASEKTFSGYEVSFHPEAP